MNPAMYAHPAVQENIEKLKKWGVGFIEPAVGIVACGDEGRGRLAEIEDIFKAAKDVIEK
jgi:phosphopantothenoylcysteine synthetase/decarboxylase